jgi:hypothetical protein
MAYDRTGTGPWGWVKSIGSASDPLDEFWLHQNGYLTQSVWFSKYPRSIRARDLLVYYAATHRVFPAIVEVVSNKVHDDDEGHPRYGKRWQWKMEVRTHVAMDLASAPTLGESSIDPLRLRRQSHILLTTEEFELLRELILGRATQHTALPKAPTQRAA